MPTALWYHRALSLLGSTKRNPCLEVACAKPKVAIAVVATLFLDTLSYLAAHLLGRHLLLLPCSPHHHHPLRRRKKNDFTREKKEPRLRCRASSTGRGRLHSIFGVGLPLLLLFRRRRVRSGQLRARPPARSRPAGGSQRRIMREIAVNLSLLRRSSVPWVHHHYRYLHFTFSARISDSSRHH